MKAIGEREVRTQRHVWLSTTALLLFVSDAERV